MLPTKRQHNVRKLHASSWLISGYKHVVELLVRRGQGGERRGERGAEDKGESYLFKLTLQGWPMTETRASPGIPREPHKLPTFQPHVHDVRVVQLSFKRAVPRRWGVSSYMPTYISSLFFLALLLWICRIILPPQPLALTILHRSASPTKRKAIISIPTMRVLLLSYIMKLMVLLCCVGTALSQIEGVSR